MKKYVIHLFRTPIFFGIFLALGILLRLYFSSLAFRGIVFDMRAYIELAQEIISRFLVADCCTKNLGYPMFITFLFKIFGLNNLEAIRMVQVVLDTATGIVFYFIGRRYFPEATSRIFFILYMLNPFSAALTGLILPDSYTFFLLSLLVLCITDKNFREMKLLWFLTGLLCGILLFTRHQFYYISFFLFLLLGFTIVRTKFRLLFFFLIFEGFFLASLYTLTANYTEFRAISLMPPYPPKGGLLYNVFFQIAPWGEVEYIPMHPEQVRIFAEFHETPLEQKAAWSDRYTGLFLEKLRTEWPLFIFNWVRNAAWIWDKEHIFIYEDPFYPGDRWPLRIYNLFLFLCFGIGFWTYVKRYGKKIFTNVFFLFTVLLFLNISVLFSLVSSESRHSLIFYPFLMMWASNGIYELKNKMHSANTR